MSFRLKQWRSIGLGLYIYDNQYQPTQLRKLPFVNAAFAPGAQSISRTTSDHVLRGDDLLHRFTSTDKV